MKIKKQIIKKEGRKWRGAISYCRKLTKQAVICLFADGTWRASATDGHTHTVDYLHFRKGKLQGKMMPFIEKYFQLVKEFPENGDEIQEIKNEIYGW